VNLWARRELQICGNSKYIDSGRSGTMELKEELRDIGLALVWRKQQECNLRDILRLVKEKCNYMKHENIFTKFPGKGSLTLYRELNFSWGKNLCTECCSRKERSGIA
jgi:hypothetical protein